MQDYEQATLESLEIGPLPIVRQYLERLGLEEVLARHLPKPTRGRPCELPPERVLSIMVTNILASHLPLYAVPQWAEGFVPELLGLKPGQTQLLNDDRIGRAIDRLFEADAMALFTDAIVMAVRKFAIRLQQLHSDSTTVTVHGKYKKGHKPGRKLPPKITYGHNKDHRPDLKQLVAELATTADGNVPIYFKVHDGNMSDDKMHCDTWSALRDLVGSPSFLYVADCKLAVSETMQFIEQKRGKFLSVLPRTRKETGVFFDYVQSHVVDWEVVRRDNNPDYGKPPVLKERPDPGGEDRAADQPAQFIYEAFESTERSKEGFRIFWYRSSQKMRDDQERRGRLMAVARMKIESLETSLALSSPIDADKALARAQAILQEQEVVDFLKVQVEPNEYEEFVQAGPGRPGPKTRYRRIEVPFHHFVLREDVAAIKAAARADGLFPLITNSETLTPKAALDIYKQQPFLEKRHQQLKSVLEMAPVNLKSPTRVAALLLVDYLALLIYSLIERDVRKRMRKANIASLPLYPEQRLSRAPTTDLIFDAFGGLRQHRLLAEDGTLLRTFYDAPTPVAMQLLQLLDVNPKAYGQHP